jgi:hypothetical protein
MSPDEPIEQALAGLRHDLRRLRDDVGQRFHTSDSQFSYLDRRFHDTNQRLAGAEYRLTELLDCMGHNLDVAVRRAARQQVATVVCAQLVSLAVLVLLQVV